MKRKTIQEIKKAAIKKAPVKKAPVKKAPAKKAAVKKTAVKKAPPKKVKAAAIKRSRLFFLQGRHLVIEEHLITIHGVKSKMTWFDDRPNRDSGSVDVEDFVRLFEPKRIFHKDAPNAMLVAKRLQDNKIKKMVVTLFAPTYLEREEKLFFKIRHVKGLPMIKGSFDAPAFFID